MVDNKQAYLVARFESQICSTACIEVLMLIGTFAAGTGVGSSSELPPEHAVNASSMLLRLLDASSVS